MPRQRTASGLEFQISHAAATARRADLAARVIVEKYRLGRGGWRGDEIIDEIKDIIVDAMNAPAVHYVANVEKDSVTVTVRRIADGAELSFDRELLGEEIGSDRPEDLKAAAIEQAKTQPEYVWG